MTGLRTGSHHGRFVGLYGAVFAGFCGPDRPEGRRAILVSCDLANGILDAD